VKRLKSFRSFFVLNYDRVNDMNTRKSKALFIFGWGILSGTLLLGFWFFNSKDSGGDEAKEITAEIVEEKFRLVEYIVEDGDTWEKIENPAICGCAGLQYNAQNETGLRHKSGIYL